MKRLFLLVLSIVMVLSTSVVFFGTDTTADKAVQQLADTLTVTDTTVNGESADAEDLSNLVSVEDGGSVSVDGEDVTASASNADSESEAVSVPATVQQADYSAQLTATLGNHLVVVKGNLPEGATLSLTEVDMDTAQQLATDMYKKEAVFACDIKIIDADGNQWQPDDSVQVTVSDLSIGEDQKLGFLHISEDLTEVVAQENKADLVEDLSYSEITEDGYATFETTGFSTFVGYTVDFHYNGQTFNIEGESSTLLSKVFTELGIEKDATQAVSVVFSDETLISTARQEDGDWLLTSLAPFSTNETLTITFEGEVLVLDVTDATWTGTCNVHVFYNDGYKWTVAGSNTATEFTSGSNITVSGTVTLYVKEDFYLPATIIVQNGATLRIRRGWEGDKNQQIYRATGFDGSLIEVRSGGKLIVNGGWSGSYTNYYRAKQTETVVVPSSTTNKLVFHGNDEGASAPLIKLGQDEVGPATGGCSFTQVKFTDAKNNAGTMTSSTTTDDSNTGCAGIVIDGVSGTDGGDITFTRCEFAQLNYWSTTANKAKSAGSAVTICEGFKTTGTVKFDACTFNQNQAGVAAGAIRVANCNTNDNINVLTITGCTFTDCSAINTGTGASRGGAVNIHGKITTMNVTNSSFSNCSTGGGAGGAINFTSSAYVSTCNINGSTSFSSCEAVGRGGAIATHKGGTITTFNINTSGTFSDCKSSDTGGAMDFEGTSTNVNFQAGTISGCKSTAENGGGIRISSNVTKFTMSGGTITGCSGSNGGGLRINSTNAALTAGYVYNNSATTNGGGVYFAGAGTLTLSGTAIGKSGNTNTATNGAGLYISSGTVNLSTNLSYNDAGTSGSGVYQAGGTFNLTGGAVTANASCTNGGGIYVASGTCNIDGGDVTSNTGNSYGGGIYVAGGTVKVNNTSSEVSSNGATHGGGIFVNSGTLEVKGGDIKSNTASQNGGGIYNKGTFTLDSSSSEITGNSAGTTATYYGGGIYSTVGMTLTNGVIRSNKAYHGAGICITGGETTMASGVTIGGSTSLTNTATAYGGGAYVSGGTLTMNGGTISYNNGTHGGGVFVNGGTCNLAGGTISTNTANYGGGAFNNTNGTLNVKGTTITSHTGVSQGGGVYSGGTTSISSGSIIKNSATSGGGVYVTGSGKTTTLSGATIGGSTDNKNSATNGGGVYVAGGTCNVSSSLISYNTSTQSGAGVYVVSGATCTFSGGDANYNTATQNGGGVYNAGTVTINNANSTINSNTAGANYNGGGIYSSGTINLSNGTISANGGPTNGRGIYSTGTLTMSGGTISSHTGATNGAGVYTTGTMTMSGGTITSNTVTASGGGIYSSGATTLSGGSIIKNSAASGGGVYVTGSGKTTTLSGATIGGSTDNKNSATNGGGVYVAGGTFALTSGNVTYNTATNGGGVYVVGTYSQTGGEVSGNTANTNGGGIYVNSENATITGGKVNTNNAVDGAGVYVAKATSVSNAEINGNTASGNGGGIYAIANATVNNTAISSNSALSGGGIYAQGGATVAVTDSKVISNEATGTSDATTSYKSVENGVGGGVAIDNATFTMNNSSSTAKSAIYGNTAKYAADDVFASGNNTKLDILNVEDMDLSAYTSEATGWYEDYHYGDTNYVAMATYSARATSYTDNVGMYTDTAYRYKTSSNGEDTASPSLEIVDNQIMDVATAVVDANGTTKSAVEDANTYVAITLGITQGANLTVRADVYVDGVLYNDKYDDEFTFKLVPKYNIPTDSTVAVPETYTVDGEEKPLSSDGVFTLKDGETALFYNLATYTVEMVPTNAQKLYFATDYTITDDNDVVLEEEPHYATSDIALANSNNRNVVYSNDTRSIDITLNYYDRKVVDGAPADISSEATTFTVNYTGKECITTNSNGVEVLDFSALINKTGIALNNYDTGLSDNVLDDYYLFSSQAEAVEQMQKMPDYYGYRPAYSTSFNYYTADEVVYHTNQYSRPQTSGEKWVNYYNRNDEVVDFEGAEADKANSVSNISVWLFNNLKQYTVKMNTITSEGECEEVFTAFYNQRLGYETFDEGGASTAHLTAYGLRGSTEQTTKTVETSGDLVFSHWVDENGNIISTDREYMYRVTGNMTLTAVYASTATDKKGITVTGSTDVYTDDKGVSQTRLNTIMNPYNFKDDHAVSDANIKRIAAIYVVASSDVDMDKVREEVAEKIASINPTSSGRVALTSASGMNYYVFVDFKLTNKNRTQFVLTLPTSSLQGRRLLTFASLYYDNSADEEREDDEEIIQKWFVSDNCVDYNFD